MSTPDARVATTPGAPAETEPIEPPAVAAPWSGPALAGGPAGVCVSTLSNGLTVVAEELHHAPVVSFWAAYRVGSRNERPGRTGVSHWLEHMLFKPTEAFPGAERDRLIAREGGLSNAFTWVDGTAYYTTIPSAQADLVYRIEADRLANTVLDPGIFETERAVVLAERQASENDPYWRLAEEVVARSFDTHSYGHEIIGSEADLRRLTLDEADEHLRTYYVPNNAVLIAAGDFRTEELLPRLEELFGGIPAAATWPEAPVSEAPLTAERRVHQEGAGGVGYIYSTYRAPAASDPDFVPTMVLASILGGPQSLTSSSGESRTSRLYRALVERGLAVDVDCTLQATIDPFLLDLTVVLTSGREHQECEDAVDEVMADVIARPVSEAELARAKKQITARFVFENDRMTHRAMTLMFASTVFGMDLLGSAVERVNAVTAEDVQRVAAKLLRKEARVMGWYVSEEEDE